MIPEPIVVERKCGGWLATSPNNARALIGVTADTEKEVVAEFKIVYARWLELLKHSRFRKRAA